MGVTGEELSAERRAHKITQQALAARLGLSRTTLWAWEHRASVPYPDADRYRRALRDLTTEEGEHRGRNAA